MKKTFNIQPSTFNTQRGGARHSVRAVVCLTLLLASALGSSAQFGTNAPGWLTASNTFGTNHPGSLTASNTFATNAPGWLTASNTFGTNHPGSLTASNTFGTNTPGWLTASNTFGTNHPGSLTASNTFGTNTPGWLTASNYFGTNHPGSINPTNSFGTNAPGHLTNSSPFTGGAWRVGLVTTNTVPAYGILVSGAGSTVLNGFYAASAVDASGFPFPGGDGSLDSYYFLKTDGSYNAVSYASGWADDVSGHADGAHSAWTMGYYYQQNYAATVFSAVTNAWQDLTGVPSSATGAGTLPVPTVVFATNTTTLITTNYP